MGKLHVDCIRYWRYCTTSNTLHILSCSYLASRIRLGLFMRCVCLKLGQCAYNGPAIDSEFLFRRSVDSTPVLKSFSHGNAPWVIKQQQPQNGIHQCVQSEPFWWSGNTTNARNILTRKWINEQKCDATASHSFQNKPGLVSKNQDKCLCEFQWPQ